ncbi:hypothetical protein WJ96_07405 [Burkholderia ubonensis]|uniref:Murein endopeptidase K n=1 Tax=Burkholderia ubonensis TaxID=101571 RepID=A0AAW3MWZ3_9BURK|nr:DUF882 domain-containing protein [Burkholderia ubonensis]KVP75525.1 hypothetical protein WJ93_09195 [Burkholderia ubonensis]KVP96988.1 hypothetical protein WJ97_14305 [Burkholderia ubonensis]KVP98339.1 hypothetical protein WJ96_07405 [Burkholderia ubonensis]KVZ93037.1 hypothetical protein WL25_19065 [Burkholderia ubonensis]
MDRRDFLKQGLRLGAAAAGSLVLPAGFTAQAQAAELGFDLTRGSRVLNLTRPESGEKLNIEYMRDGRWLDNSYSYLCWLLRDIHVNKHVAMDYNLIAILDWTQWYLRQYGYTQPLQILSGYRTPYTNEHTEGAKKDSQHLYGKAIDLRIPGVSAEYLGKLFRWLSRGGVGVYPGSNFVHIDTGRVRTWRG